MSAGPRSVLFTVMSAVPRKGLAQARLPTRICGMNNYLKGARENVHISRGCKDPAWLVSGQGKWQVGAARDGQVLGDQITKSPVLLAKDGGCILKITEGQWSLQRKKRTQPHLHAWKRSQAAARRGGTAGKEASGLLICKMDITTSSWWAAKLRWWLRKFMQTKHGAQYLARGRYWYLSS